MTGIIWEILPRVKFRFKKIQLILEMKEIMENQQKFHVKKNY